MTENDAGRPAATAQRLDAALNSVASVLDALATACAPVAPVTLALQDAEGAVAAADVLAPEQWPACDVALVAGRALASSDLLGASPMSPVFASADPPRVGVGDPMPAGCDCVIDDSLVAGDGGMIEIHGAAAPGEGVRHAGDDLQLGEAIVTAGARVSALSLAALQAARISAIAVRRARVRLVGVPHASGAEMSLRLVAALAGQEGAAVEIVRAHGRDAQSIAQALTGDGAAPPFDVALVVGGSGLGGDDCAVHALRRCGTFVAHGLALDPGRTGAAGVSGGKPVVCLPGRFDCALGVYLALALPILRRLGGAVPPAPAAEGRLSRKIASSVGVAQLALLRRGPKDEWIPLCVGDAPLSRLLGAHAYIVVPEGSEGLAQGSLVAPLPLPGRSG